MAGPHPAVARVRSAVRAALAEGSADVLVACSGGPDSVALAAAVAFEAPKAGRRAGLVTVDHGLQAGSAEVAARVAGLGAELGLDPVHAVRVDVGRAGGPENAARAARYRALDEVAAAHDADLLLGHTLDDQAETVLLGLGRGSGARSLAGMVGRAGRHVRPLLGLRRADTEAACAALGLDVWHDPHNTDPAYRRVRVRGEVLPLLEEVLGGGVAEALARTADLLRADADALDAWAAGATAEMIRGKYGPGPAFPSDRDGRDGPDELEVTALAGLPAAVRTRVLRRWATAPGQPPLTAERTAALDALVTGWHGQGPVELPGGRAVRRVAGRLVLARGV